MSRIKLTEHRAKSLLLGGAYRGIPLRSGAKMVIPKGRWVAKVDQGVKKRMKQGLVAVDKPAKALLSAIRSWEKKGFSNFILEPFLPHDAKEERYFSLERVRDGVRMLYAKEGGIDIEAHPEAVEMYLIRNQEDVPAIAKKAELPEKFLADTYEVFDSRFFSFLEINPLVVKGGTVHLLDAALLVDSAAAFFAGDSWSEKDALGSKAKHRAEQAVAELQKTTPASLKLTVMNPNGALFFLLSGGGGSIVIADEAAEKGAGKLIGNYGEYSGGPTREEVHLYAREVLDLMLASKAKKKALVIAGGVANFTDVKATFAGIIDAFREKAVALKKAGVKVFVRRGGPNEAAGLRHMRGFLSAEGLLGSVHGSDAPLTQAVDEAVTFLKP